MAPAAGKAVLLLLGWAGNQAAARRQAAQGGMSDMLEGMMSSVRSGDGAALGVALSQMKTKISPESATSIRGIIDPAIEEVRSRISAQAQATQRQLNEIVDNLRKETGQGFEAKKTADNIDEIWVQCVGDEKAGLQRMEASIRRREENRNETRLACAARDAAAIIEIDPVPIREVSCNFLQGDNCVDTLAAEEQYYEEVKARTAAKVAELVENYQNLDAECGRLTDVGDQLEGQIAADEQAFFFQMQGCQRLQPKRQTAMCFYGVKLLYKCNHLGEYNALVAKIRGTGTEHSHPDRVAETVTMLTASCLIDRHLLGGQEYDERSLDVCKQESEKNGQVQAINLKESVVAGISGNLSPCTEGSTTFSGQSWNLPTDHQPTSQEYELVQDYTVAVNLHDPANALPQCAGFSFDYPQSAGQCGTAKQCGSRNQLFIGSGGANSGGGSGGFNFGFGFFKPSDYDETDEQHAEVLCGPKCFSNWQCAGFYWQDNKCFYKKNVECGSLSEEGTCFTKRSRGASRR